MSFSRAQALDFQGLHVIFKSRSLGFSDSQSFSRAAALGFQGLHVISKGPSLGFSPSSNGVLNLVCNDAKDEA